MIVTLFEVTVVILGLLVFFIIVNEDPSVHYFVMKASSLKIMVMMSMMMVVFINSFKLKTARTCCCTVATGFVSQQNCKGRIMMSSLLSSAVTVARAVELKHNASLISALTNETSKLFSSAGA